MIISAQMVWKLGWSRMVEPYLVRFMIFSCRISVLLTFVRFRLNEGLADLYERYIPEMVWPEERHMDLFVINYAQMIFEFDSNPNVRPMTQDADTPDEIIGLFDGVAYAKC